MTTENKKPATRPLRAVTTELPNHPHDPMGDATKGYFTTPPPTQTELEKRYQQEQKQHADMRRLILIGATTVAAISNGELIPKTTLLAQLHRYLARTDDRDLFDLPPATRTAGAPLIQLDADPQAAIDSGELTPKAALLAQLNLYLDRTRRPTVFLPPPPADEAPSSLRPPAPHP